MKRKKIVRTRTPTGHGLMNEGAPHDSAGRLSSSNRFMVRSSGVGRAKCRCGVVSDVLHSGAERKRWHVGHKKLILDGAPDE